MIQYIKSLILLCVFLTVSGVAQAQLVGADGNYVLGTEGTLATGLNLNSTPILGISGTTLNLGASILTAINLGNSGATTTIGGTLGVTGATTLTELTMPPSGGITSTNGTLNLGNNKSYTPSGAVTPFFNALIGSVSGTMTGNLPSFFNITVGGDTADAHAATNDPVLVHMQDNYGNSASMEGGRYALLVNSSLEAGTQSGNNAANINAFFGVAEFWQTVSNTEGGTAPTLLGGRGQFINLNPQLTATSAATNMLETSLAEYDIGLSAGSSTARKFGIKITQLSGDAVQGSVADAAVRIGGASNLGWKNGLLFGGDIAHWETPGTLIAAQYGNEQTGFPNTSNWGLDLLEDKFSAFASNGGVIRSQGFMVGGEGTTQIGVANLTPSTTALTIDTPGAVETAMTINAGGSSCVPGDILDFGNNGRALVTTVSGGTAITGFSVLNAPYDWSGSPPSTLAATAYPSSLGPCAGVVFNVTWTKGTTLSLGTSAATAINVGNSSSTTTVTGGAVLTNSTSAATLTLSGNNSTMTNASTCTWMCMSGNIGGSTTNATPTFVTWAFSDNVKSTNNLDGQNLVHNIAPNGNIASGPRVTVNYNQTTVGSANPSPAVVISSAQISGTTLTVTTISSGTVVAGQGVAVQTLATSSSASISGTALTVGGTITGTFAVGEVIPYQYGVPPDTTIASGSGSSWVLSAASPYGYSGAIVANNVPESTLIQTFGTGGSTGTGAAGTYALNFSGYLPAASSQNLTGMYSLNGENDTLRLAGWLKGQNGSGSPGVYSGANEAVNIQCEEFSNAVWWLGCNIGEMDMVSQAGAIFRQNNGWSWVSEEAAEGQMGLDNVEFYGKTTGSFGFARLRVLIGDNAVNPMDTYGVIDALKPNSLTSGGAGGSLLGMGRDYSYAVYSGPEWCEPYECKWTLKATGITGATRLTSDGNTANGWIVDAESAPVGSGYTYGPQTSVTGCGTAPTINTAIGAGGALTYFGVYNQGAACKAEASLSVPAPVSGTQAGARLHVTGNTLNLPINSTNLIQCAVVGNDNTPGAIGWTIAFTATMGATASTMAIVGSPSWTAIGTDTNLAIAAPTADTTLGAINITVTPSGGKTANVGGSCTITSSQQII